ncbi:MAG TPA: hypothetical protein ENH43_00180 [Phycisphaerales bacterium]|nr:hypothetical protein [Phycisphaerales bacterium]
MKSRMRVFVAGMVLCFLIPSAGKAGVSVIGGLTHQRKAVPGEIYKGAILLKNAGTEPEEIKIYQTDYQFRFDGTNDYGPPGEAERSNADWLSFNPHRFIIPPDNTVTVNYTVKVPNAPNLVGTYWSMLMVEGIPKSSPLSTQPEKNKAKVGITQIIRYGIQMVAHISNTGERKLKFLETKLLKEDKKRILQIDMENTGQWWLRPSVWVELYGQDGRYIGRFDGGRKRIYPGTSVRNKVDLSNVPEGKYKALVVADSGGDYIFGANYTLKFEK